MPTTVAPEHVPVSSPSKLDDWHEFCATHFPGRSERHNLEAVVAYGVFRKKHPLQDDSSGSSETREGDRTAMGDWENEGGS